MSITMFAMAALTTIVLFSQGHQETNSFTVVQKTSFIHIMREILSSL